jgi:hypothetical protein
LFIFADPERVAEGIYIYDSCFVSLHDESCAVNTFLKYNSIERNWTTCLLNEEAKVNVNTKGPPEFFQVGLLYV